MPRTIENPQTPGEPAVGVLLVHGIGQQERGDTLLGFGEPLYKWMNAWVNKTPYPDPNGHNNVRLDDTSLLRPPRASLDAPPSMVMHVSWNDGGEGVETRPAGTPPDHAVSFLVAESWWAKDFREARFRQLFVWGVAYAPWVIWDYAEHRRKQARRDCGRLRPGRSLAAWREAGFSLAVAAVATVLAPVGAFLFQVAMLALLLLALVPALRGWVAGLQARLAGAVGDAYLLATSPVRFDAMASQVQRDLAWMAERLAKNGKSGPIAVLAHSQGSVVAHEALRGLVAARRDTDPIPPVRLFVTFGNAFVKLGKIRRALPLHDRFARRAVACYAGLAAVLIAFAWGPLRLPEGAEWPRLTVGVAGCLAIFWAHTRQMPKIDGLQPGDLDVPGFDAAEGWTWQDYFATADPVPDGPVPDDVIEDPARANGRPDRFRSTKVRNRDSVFADHTTYWQNAEQFVGPVARALVGLAGESFLVADGDEDRLREAAQRRGPRVDALRVAGWIAFAAAAVPLAAAVLSAFTKFPGPPLAGLARWGAAVAEPALGWVTTLLGVGGLTDGALAPWIGGAMVAAAAWAYRAVVLVPLWRRWDQCMAEQLFGRAWRPWRHSRMGLFAVAATAPLPAAAGGLALRWASWPATIAVAVVVGLAAAWAVGVRPVRAGGSAGGGGSPAAPAGPRGWTTKAARAEP